jgi:hypothetical protein
MRHEWGRAPDAGRWQRAMPVWFMSITLLALVSGIGMWFLRQTFAWTPLQQFYLSAYTRSALASSLGIRTGRYRVLLMENRRGSRLAIDDEIVPIASSTGETTFALGTRA